MFLVIAHQAVDVTAPMLLVNFASEEAEKLLAIGVVEKDELLGIAACSHVVQCTGKFKAQGAGHDARQSGERGAKSRTDPILLVLTTPWLDLGAEYAADCVFRQFCQHYSAS